MEKRAYCTPTILRVQLTHEQAVLSTCSTLAAVIVNGTQTSCRNNSRGTQCRKGASGSSADSGSSS